MLTRYYLFNKSVDGELHGRGTVLMADGSGGDSVIVISCLDLSPTYFREIVLQDSNLDYSSFVFEAILTQRGVCPPSVVEPHVVQIRRVG